MFEIVVFEAPRRKSNGLFSARTSLSASHSAVPDQPLRRAPRLSARDVAGIWVRQVLKYFSDVPCMKRVYRIGEFVSSQGRRALPVSVINRWSTCRCFPPGVYKGFPLFVLAKRRSGPLSSKPWKPEERFFLGRTDPSASYLPRLAPPRRPTVRRPALNRFLCVRVLDSTSNKNTVASESFPERYDIEIG